MKTHKYVGLDVHSVDTVIAGADGGGDGEVRLYSKVRVTCTRSRTRDARSAAKA